MSSPSSLFRWTLAVVVILWACLVFVEASSPPQRPLKRLAQPSILTLEILPRRTPLQQRSSLSPSLPPISPDSPVLQHSDSFRLTLSAFEQTFHLHLHPNPHLLHPSARINYYKNGPDGKAVLDRVEPLLRSDVKAYWGDVVHPDASHGRLREDTIGGLLYSNTRPSGWARIMIHHQGDVGAGIPPVFEGAFSTGGVVYHVMTEENYLRTKLIRDPDVISAVDDQSSSLVIYRDKDIMTHDEEAAQLPPFDLPVAPSFPEPNHEVHTCSHDDLDWNVDSSLNPTLRKPAPPSWFERLGLKDDLGPIGVNVSNWIKRDDVAGSPMNTNFADHIGQTAGCPISQQIVYMGVAADCRYVQQYGSQQNATSAILNDWNMASALYKTTFNVSLGIVQLDMHDGSCPSPVDQTRPWNVDCGNVTLNDRLSLFSKWRGDKGEDGTGLWHLMSGCPTGTEVGVAWLGTLCQTTATGSTGNFVSGTAVTTAGRAEWQVVAHEIGHNFGAIHDCVGGCNSTSTCCPLTTSQCDTSSKFLMSPTSSLDETLFSFCTIGNICSLMLSKTTNMTCVQPPDPNKQTLSLQMCGNGIVETGEDCDPGRGRNSTCCNATTCKFTSGSVCDPASSTCCTQQCQFAPSTQICRPSQDPTCDVAESCTGTSSTCPWDMTAPDGTSCGSDGLACASGKCTSESRQCQTIGASMGLTTACPNKGDTSCQVSCQDPKSANQCVVLQAQLVDGSPCGYGGKCAGGKCNPGNLFDTAKAWYVQNLQISIPVTVVVCILVLFILFALFRCARRCCGGRHDYKSQEPALRAIPAQRLSSWIGPPSELIRPPNRPEPGVWIPPPARPLRNGPDRSRGPRGGSSGNIPAALRAGSEAGLRNAPSTTTNPGAAYGAQNGRYPQMPSARTHPSRQRTGGSGGGDRSHWVDATAWNGAPP